MIISHSSGKQRGFTLIELLVAMTITAIIVGVLVSITGTAVDTWNRSREELRASRQAEAMIQIMSKDLESLVMRSGSEQEWLSAIRDVPADGGSPNAARLIFFTAATDRYDGQVGVQGEDLGGDVSCVAYQLAWKDPVSPDSAADEFETFVLNRLLVNPDLTFQNLLGQTDKDDPTLSLDTIFANNYGAQIDQDRNFVCENILQFTLVFHIETYDSVGNLNNEMISISTATDGKTRLRVHHDQIEPDPEQTDLAKGVLTAVEVSVTVLTDRAITQLRDDNDLADNSDWLSANSFHFSRLIQVPRK